MLKIHFWMEIFNMKFIWCPLLVFHMILDRFVSSRKCYTISNKHLMLGLKNSLLIFFLNFVSNSHNYTLFVKYIDSGHIILFLYVDDIIITGDDIDDSLVLKTELARQFEMKNLGSLWYFLGIEIVYSPRCYLLYQSKYVTDIIERVRLIDNKTVDTLIEANTMYSFSNGLLLPNSTLYCIIIRSLIYLTISRQDITYVIHVISQFVASSTFIL